MSKRDDLKTALHKASWREKENVNADAFGNCGPNGWEWAAKDVPLDGRYGIVKVDYDVIQGGEGGTVVVDKQNVRIIDPYFDYGGGDDCPAGVDITVILPLGYFVARYKKEGEE